MSLAWHSIGRARQATVKERIGLIVKSPVGALNLDAFAFCFPEPGTPFLDRFPAHVR